MDYQLRTLKSDDMFIMFNIINKIGLKDLKESMSMDKLTELMNAQTEGDSATYIGFSLMMDVVEIIISNLSLCKSDIYTFLSNLSGLSVDDIADLDMGSFTGMIVDVIQKEEFKDFFKAVSRLLNLTI